jgi:hypothetical protein
VIAAADHYVCLVRDLYLKLPITANRFNQSDRLVAAELYRRSVPLDLVRSAFVLAAARRLTRNPNLLPLTPVRSLRYFLPVIDEIRAQPLPPRYIEYLESKLR